jgi:hypothetical protein
MSNVTLNTHRPPSLPSLSHAAQPSPRPQAAHLPPESPGLALARTVDSFQPASHGGAPERLAQAHEDSVEDIEELIVTAPSKQTLLERVTGFFKGFGLGALEVVQSLGQFARNVNDVNPLLIATGTLADFIVAPLKGRSPGQVLQDRGQRTQEAGRALLNQTGAMMKLAADLSPAGQRDNFIKMSGALAQDLLALSNRGQLTPAKVMEAVRGRTQQNPSVQAAKTLIDSVTNYKAILSSGGSAEEIGKGAFRIFSALAPFAKAKVAGRAAPAGVTAPPSPQGITSIIRQPAPPSPTGFRGTIARVPNNPVGRAYVQAYDLAKQLAGKQGGKVQGIGGSIAEGRGRLGTFDRGVWTHETAQRLDKMPISADGPLPPQMEALARQLPPGSIEAKLAGGKSIPSDMDIVLTDLPYAQQKAIKAEVFNRTGVLIEFVQPNPGKLPATGLGH